MARAQSLRIRSPAVSRRPMHHRHHWTLAAAAAIAVPLAALGQELDLDQVRSVDADHGHVTHQNLTAAQIEAMNVVRENTLVGEIEDVLVNDRDEIVAVVVNPASPSPAERDRQIVVPIEHLEFDEEGLQAATTLTDDELNALPEWES